MARNKNNKNNNLNSKIAKDVEFAAETSVSNTNNNNAQQTNIQNPNK